MASMILEVYDAFRSVGIDEDKARKAAGARSDNPRAIAELGAEMRDEFSKVRAGLERTNGRITLLNLQFGILVAGVATLILKAFA